MPTRKPRVNVALEPRLYEALRRVGELRGLSASAVIRGFLEPSTELLERIADELERVKAVEAGTQEDLARASDDAADRLLALWPTREVLEGQLSMFGEDAKDGAAAPPAAPAAEARKGKKKGDRGGRS